MLKEKDLVHKDCGGKLLVELGDNDACNDPECCGGATYHIEIKCSKCKKELTIY